MSWDELGWVKMRFEITIEITELKKLTWSEAASVLDHTWFFDIAIIITTVKASGALEQKHEHEHEHENG